MTKKRSSYPWSQSLQVRVKEEALALLSLLQALLEPSRRFGGVVPNLVPVLPLLVLALSSLCLPFSAIPTQTAPEDNKCQKTSLWRRHTKPSKVSMLVIHMCCQRNPIINPSHSTNKTLEGAGMIKEDTPIRFTMVSQKSNKHTKSIREGIYLRITTLLVISVSWLHECFDNK